jgi:homoserine dehydrogenase
MKKVPLVLTGYGNVGKSFVRLLLDKREDCARRYGLDLDLTAVLRRSGGWVGQGCEDFESLAGDSSAPLESHSGWKPGLTLAEALPGTPAGVLVECTPSDWKTGAPQLEFLHLALDRGWNIAAASKGALVVDFKNLRTKARAKGLALKFSGATAAALPTLDVATISLAGTDILRIDGILTGTTNYILGRLEEGLPFETALAEAQAKGIAEPDPSMDIDGWDTACKLLLIANSAADGPDPQGHPRRGDPECHGRGPGQGPVGRQSPEAAGPLDLGRRPLSGRGQARGRGAEPSALSPDRHQQGHRFPHRHDGHGGRDRRQVRPAGDGGIRPQGHHQHLQDLSGSGMSAGRKIDPEPRFWYRGPRFPALLRRRGVRAV